MHSCGLLKNHSDLESGAHKIYNKYDVSFIRYMFDKSYSSHVHTNMKKIYDAPDGITDSVRQLLLRNDPYNRYVLNLLLMPSF